MGINVNCTHCGRYLECLHPESERKGWLRILGKHPGCHMVMPGGTCELQEMYPRPTNPPCGQGYAPPPPPPLRIVLEVKGIGDAR